MKLKTAKVSNCFFKCLLIILLTNSWANAQDNTLIDKIAGVVGDKIVLTSDIQVQVAQAKMQGGATPDIECQVLDQLLMEKLLVNQAELDSVMVSEDEVEIELDNRLRYYINMMGTEEKFIEYYQKSILEFKEDFRPDIKQMMLAQRMQSQIVANIKVSPIEVKEFFEEIPKDSLPYFNAEVEVSEIIFIPVITEEAKTAAKTKLNQIRSKINDGTNTFDEMAQIYSEDPGSAPQGGRMGLQDRGTFVKEFEATAYKLAKNEVSSVIQTEFGFHILKLLERRGNKVDVQHILIKPEVSFNDLDLANKRADSVRNLILVDSLSFQEAVEIYTEDENSKNFSGMLVNQQTGSTYFELNQLTPDVFFAVEGLKEGEMSAPTMIKLQDGKQQYKLFFVQSRSEPHQANLDDDFERLKNVALQQKQNETVSKWVAEKSAKTYIKLSPEYHGCDTMIKWNKL